MTFNKMLITMVLPLRGYLLLLLVAGSSVQSAKPTINAAMIGDYGMTTLAAAITRVQSEKGLAKLKTYEDIIHEEESDGSVTYHQASICFKTDSREYILYDWDHQIDTVKALLLKETLDAVILVVSPTFTAIPSIRIEVEMAYKVGVKNILVFINENNDANLVEQFQVTIRELLEKAGFDVNRTPIISGSAHAGLYEDDDRPIEELLAAMDSETTIPPPIRDEDKPFLMQVSDYVHLSDNEILALGIVRHGSASDGDLVDLVGSIVQPAAVKGLQVVQGPKARIIKMELELTTKFNGDNPDWSVISEPGTIAPHSVFKAEVYFATYFESGVQSTRVFVDGYHTTMKMDIDQHVGVDMRFSDSDTTYKAPGAYASVILETDRPTPLRLYQHFDLTEFTTTVAFGVITEIME